MGAESQSSKDKKTGNAHDTYFCAVFDNPDTVKALLKLVLTQDQLALIDLRTIRIENPKLAENAGFSKSDVDLLISARLKNTRDSRILYVIEHKSSPDGNLMMQLFKYQAHLYVNYDAKVVVPITIYHGKRRNWTGPLTFQLAQMKELPGSVAAHHGQEILNFRPTMVNLNDAAVKRRWLRLPLEVQLSLEMMVRIWHADLHTYIEMRERAKSLPDEIGSKLLCKIVQYLIKVHPRITIKILERYTKDQLGEDKLMEEFKYEWDKMFTKEELHEQFRKEGYLEGEEEGIVKGEKVGLKKGEKVGLEKGEKVGLEKGEKVGLEKGEKVGLKKGEKVGRQRGIEETASRMIQHGFTDEDISSITALSLERVRKLRNCA